MTTVGNKAKVTVTYRPNESLAPATGEIVCTAAQATIGKARFKVATSGWKVWDDGTYCAKFYTGSDSTSVGVSLGAVNDGVFFCAEETDKPGTVISYDSYEVSSSNDDVMTANIEDNLDTGKYCRIAVSGNTVGTANILVKATKNGADYTYTIPVKVVAEKKLTGITVSASRPSMSNAIDEDYYGTLTVTGKYSDGTTSTISSSDYTSEVADAEKNNKLSNNLLKAMGETQDEHTATTARGAEPFMVNGAYYSAGGAQGKTYTINVSTTNEDNKEVKAGTTVKVSDLSESAWKLGGDGAAMEYSVELSNGNALDVSATTTYTVARLAAYANKLFAGYVRQDEAGNVVIGTSTDATEGVDGTYASAYIKAPGETEDRYIQIASTVVGDTLDEINFTADAERGTEVTPGEAGEGYKWIETNNALADGIFNAGKTISYTKDEDGLYTVNTKKSKASADEFILVKLPAIEEPTEDQTGIEAVAGEAGDGYEWVATNTAKAGAAGFTPNGTTSYTKSPSDVYTENAGASTAAANEYILITPAEIVEEPTSAQLGTIEVEATAGEGYMWVATDSDAATAVGFVAGGDDSYTKTGNVYTLNPVASKEDAGEYILVSVTLVTTPTDAQKGTADTAAVPGDGNVWVAYDDVKDAGIEAGTQKYKAEAVAGGTNKYYTIDTTNAAQNTMVLVHYAAATPNEDQLGTAEVAAVPGDDYSWVATDSAKAINAGFEAGTTTSYTKTGDAYEENTEDSTRSENEYILIKKSTIVTEPTETQLGTAATAGAAGEGFTWMTTEDAVEAEVGFEAGVTPSYTKTADDVYVLNTVSTESNDEYVLISAASIVTEPSEEQLGSEASEGDETTYSWDATTKTLTIATFEDATTDELIEELSNILENNGFVVEEVEELPDDVEEIGPGDCDIIPGVDPIYENYGVGQAQPTAKTTISGIYAAVKAGHLYSVNGMIFDSASNVAIEKDNVESATQYTTSIPVSARAWTNNDLMLVGNTKYDYYFAKPGTYTPTFFFTMDGKDKTASTSVTVKNGFTAPVVTVNQRKLDSLTVDDIRDALTINCDMNNNTSSAASFTGDVYKNDTTLIIAESESDGDKWTATYIGVDDQDITFIVPINATFYAD